MERSAWIGLAAVMTRLPSVLDSELKAATGLSQFEYLVLARLSEMPDRTLQLKNLAMLANGSLSRLSHVLSRLESRGWLRRCPLPDDGRLTVAVLTDDGWAKVVASAPHHLGSVRAHVMDLLSPTQIRQLRSITRTLMPGLCDTAPPVP
jgi:DNA-binding MarR family transcriptional regulator